MKARELLTVIALLGFALKGRGDPLDRWTYRTSKTTGWLKDVAYGNNQFVVVGQQGPDPSDIGLILTSPDGRTWTDRSSGAPYCSSIAFGNGTFVAAGIQGTIVTSVNATNWFTQQSGTQADLSAVAFGSGQFVVVGFDYNKGGGAILTSPDGVTWMSRNSGTTNALSDVVYGDNEFVIGGDSGTILTSPDGVVWTRRDTGTTNPILNLAYGNHLFVARPYQQNALMVLTSTDGRAWTNHVVGQGDVNYQDIVYGNNQFVAVSGIYLPTICGILTSPDGLTWTTHLTLFQALHGLAFGNNSFVAVGDSGTILQSDPIINLSLAPRGTAGHVSLSLEGPIGLHYTIQTSTDLISWQILTNVTSAQSITFVSDVPPGTAARAFYRAHSQ